MEKESGENDNFDTIVKALEEREKESKNNKPKRFVECEICHKKIRNKPDTIRSHKKYHEKKQEEKKPNQAKPVIEKEKMSVKPVSESPVKKPIKNMSMPEKKGLKINFADILLIGGLVCIGLLFMSLLKGSRPAESTMSSQAQAAEPVQQQITAPIAPPYPYYR